MPSHEDELEDLVDNCLLDEFQVFVLTDPAALQLYKLYLSQTETPQLANHIDFYVEFKTIPHSESTATNDSHTDILVEEDRVTYHDIYNKYFLEDSPQQLLIKQELLEGVRKNNDSGEGMHLAYKLVMYAVTNDLCFELFYNFISSSAFEEFKECLCIDPKSYEDLLNLPSKERVTLLRLRRFFGEKIGNNETEKLAFRSQPYHVKTWRLNRKFGERVAVERLKIIEPVSPRLEQRNHEAEKIQGLRRRSRRLHVFFGDRFEVDDTAFSERLRAPIIEHLVAVDTTVPKQPEHVNAHRLNRFFGERLNQNGSNLAEGNDSDNLSDEDGGIIFEEECELCDDAAAAMCPSRFAKTQRIMRFFGERMDINKEAGSKSFAAQPAHVRPLKLRKIFGAAPGGITADATTNDSEVVEESLIANGPPVESKRAHKLHKFFGARVDGDEEVIFDEGPSIWLANCIKALL